MDPVTLTTLAIGGAVGAGASALTSRPPLPNIPPPPVPGQTPNAKPRPKSSMQDSFLTGIAGVGNAPTPSGKTLLGQ